METGKNIEPAVGKLGVLLVGLGAVSTTFIAGVEAVRRGLAKPIGSVTQMGTIRLGKRTDKRSPLIKDFAPLAQLHDIEFLAWDIFQENAYESALHAGVVDKDLLNAIREPLEEIRPLPAAFDRDYVKRLDGPNIKKAPTKKDLADQLVEDIQEFKAKKGLDRLVMVWCGSTEIFLEKGAAHQDLTAFESAMEKNDPSIAPSMLYAYAACKLGIPYANGAPNLSADFPAMIDLAKEYSTPICGKDFKTGQTLMKTILSPGLKARCLGLNGWFSTNILGNRDGEVLDDPSSFKTKEESKLGVLDSILQPELYPDLYGNIYHKVRINYYPPPRR